MRSLSLLILSLVVSSVLAQDCPRTNKKPNKNCVDECLPSLGCRDRNKRCICDGNCGYSCVKKNLECPALRVRHGKIRGNGRIFNSIVRITCNNRYTLFGSSKRRCTGKGRWDGKKSRCKKACPDPGIPNFSRRDRKKNPVGFKVRTLLTYTCAFGYQASTSLTIECMPNKKWTSPPPVCKAKACGRPTLPANSKVIHPKKWKSNSNHPFGERIILGCKTGYRKTRLGLMRCFNSWKLVTSNFRCIAKSCGDPGTPRNGKKTGLSFTFKDVVRYSCDNCYYLNGVSYRQCLSNGRWSDTLPSCERVECKHPGDISNGKVTLSSIPMYCNSYVEYSCSTGHNLKGNARRTCKGDQRWSGSQPRCELVNCGNPGNPKNGRTIAQHGYTYAQDILFKCDDGYFMEGQSIASCQLNGRWSKDLPKCLEKCSDPTQQTNAQITGKKFYHGKKVKFACPWSNYVLEPHKPRTLTCRNGKWTGRIPQCKAPCEKLASIRSGRTYSRSLEHGSRASFKCNNGYKMIGSSVIQCSDGKWSDSIPKCLAICSIINKLKNGWVYGKGHNEGDKLSFDCLQNYVLDGEKTITCKADRRWSTRTPKCRAPCKQIKGLLYGSITRQGFKHNEEVHFMCNQDYVFEGSRIILCNDRKWSDSPPVCFAPCKKFPSNPFPKGYIKKDGFRHNEVVVFGCRGSFVIDGRAQLKCINGSWDERQPICGAPCKPLSPPANGKILGSGYRHKEKTTFACNKGYGLVGGKERLCNLGRWSGNIPQCKLVHCGDPGNPKNGRTIAKDGFSYGHKISFVCDKGYVLKGNLVATCQDNGNWSDVLPQCLEICRDPMQQTNAQIIGSKFYHGQQVKFICSGKDYVIDPSQSSTLTCQNGKWNGSIPQCKAPCSTLRKIRNGSMKVTSRTHGSKALFSCNKGYKINGTFSSQCNDGNWTAPIPNCVVVNCSDPGHPKNGTAVADDGFTYGRDVRFKCNKGYSLVGKNSATCQSNGNWSRDVPFCLIMQMPEDDDIQNAKRACFDPRKQTNARVSGREFIHGKQVKFQCKRWGYVLDPGQSATLTCQYGKWSGPIPQCKAVDCGYPGNPKNGRTIAKNGFTFRQRIYFRCDKDHYRQGSESAYCQYNGKWSRKPPKCFAPCNRFNVANSRTIFSDLGRHGSWASVYCNFGYQRSGLTHIQCKDGNWNGSIPKCLAPCKDISPPKNGRIVYKSTRHGGKIEIRCNWPRTLHGASTLTCENGSWSVPVPSCI